MNTLPGRPDPKNRQLSIKAVSGYIKDDDMSALQQYFTKYNATRNGAIAYIQLALDEMGGDRTQAANVYDTAMETPK